MILQCRTRTLVRALCLSAVTVAGCALFGTYAEAQACKVGTRLQGTTTITFMGVNVEQQTGFFQVKKFTACGIGAIVVPLRLVKSTASNCKVGSELVVAGTIRTLDKPGTTHIRAQSARCS